MHRTISLLLVALVASTLGSLVGCKDPDQLLRYRSTSLGIEALEREVESPRYDHLREEGEDPRRLVERALRDLVVRVYLTEEPPTPRERRAAEAFSRRRQSERCVEIQLEQLLLAGERDLEADARASFENHRAFEERLEAIVSQVEEGHPGEVRENLFYAPSITADVSVYSMGDKDFKVSDLLPAWDGSKPLSGPMLRRAQAGHKRWFAASLHLGCLLGIEPAVEPGDLLSLRLERSLTRFAATDMAEEIEEYYGIHRQALVRPPSYRFDLYVLPFRSNNRHADLEGYRGVVEGIRAGTVQAPLLARQGVLVYVSVELGEEDLQAYEPRLIPLLQRLGPGSLSNHVISERVGAFLFVRLQRHTQPVALDLPRPDDRQRIAAAYVADFQDEVMDRLFQEVHGKCRINRRLVEQVIQRLGNGAGPGAG